MKVNAFKKLYDYEGDVMRCATCRFYRESKVYLLNSLPRKANPLCTAAPMTTRPNSVCDHWRAKG